MILYIQYVSYPCSTTGGRFLSHTPRLRLYHPQVNNYANVDLICQIARSEQVDAVWPGEPVATWTVEAVAEGTGAVAKEVNRWRRTWTNRAPKSGDVGSKPPSRRKQKSEGSKNDGVSVRHVWAPSPFGRLSTHHFMKQEIRILAWCTCSHI